MNYKTYLGSTKKTFLIQETTEKRILKILRFKKLIPYILAIICITSLYSFEFFDSFNDEYFIAKKEYQDRINEATASLNIVKEYSIGKDVYTEYMAAKKLKDEAKKRYFEVKKDHEFFGFKTFKL